MSYPLSTEHKDSSEIQTASVIWPEAEISEADAYATQAARAIRMYYFNQLALLRELPYAALEADGHGGFQDEYSRAYGSCMMAVHLTGEWTGSYDMFIELRTGMLVNAYTYEGHTVITPSETFSIGGQTSWKLASDHDVFSKLGHQSEKYRFIPERVLKNAREMAQDPYHYKGEDLELLLAKKQVWRLELDYMMSQYPLDFVVDRLRQEGYDL